MKRSELEQLLAEVDHDGSGEVCGVALVSVSALA